jgi:hypothetical protein
MEPRYSFYEIVRVARHEAPLKHLSGLEGMVLGRGRDEQGEWYYAVHLYDRNEVRSFCEAELEATGNLGKRESLYDGSSVKVAVDPATGEGGAARSGGQAEPYDQDEGNTPGGRSTAG